MLLVYIAVFLCVFASLRENAFCLPQRRKDAEKGKIKEDIEVIQSIDVNSELKVKAKSDSITLLAVDDKAEGQAKIDHPDILS